MRPLKLQASMRAHDLARYWELVLVGHRFGKVSVLATMPSQIYSRKLEWTSNADRLKFNGWSSISDMSLIGWAIVAFVCSWLCNFCETRKLQFIHTHKTNTKKSSWHTGYNPSVSTCGPTFDPQHWHLSLRGVQCWRGHVYITLLSPTFNTRFSFKSRFTILYAIVRFWIGILRRNWYIISRSESFFF